MFLDTDSLYVDVSSLITLTFRTGQVIGVGHKNVRKKESFLVPHTKNPLPGLGGV